jgi:hypothetical protein
MEIAVTTAVLCIFAIGNDTWNPYEEDACEATEDDGPEAK